VEREEGAGVMSTLDATMELIFKGCIHFNSSMLASRKNTSVLHLTKSDSREREVPGRTDLGDVD